MLKLASFQKRKVEQTKNIEPLVEEEMKIAEINTLINGSFPTT
jgi:hypothetical protein